MGMRPSLPNMTELLRALYRDAGNRLPLSVVLTALVTATEGVALVLVFITLDRVFPLAARDLAAGSTLVPPWVTPRAIVALLVGLGTSHAVLSQVSQAANQRILMQFMARLRDRLMDAILQRSPVFLHPRASRLNHLLADEPALVNYGLQCLIAATSTAMLTLVYLLLAAWISPVGAIVVLFGTALAFALTLPIQRKNRTISQQLIAHSVSLQNETADLLGALKLVHASQRQQHFASFFSRLSHQLAATYSSLMLQMSGQRAWLQFFIVAMLATSLLVLVGSGPHHPATAIAYVLMLMRLLPKLASLQQQLQMVQPGLAAWQSINRQLQDLQSDPPATADCGSLTISASPPTISFEQVTFRYPGRSATVLDDFTAEIPAGRITVVTGASGTGKSTLFELLVRLMEPDSGVIRLNGVPLSGYRLESLRAAVCWLPQDAVLLHASVRDNLNWGRTPQTDADLFTALEIVQAADLVRGLPQGLDTIVGHRGAQLSGGQRQRLAIARALLGAPLAILLDEATNALDADSERTLIGNLRSAYPDATLVLAAHRQETLALADKIIVLQQLSVDRGDAVAP